MKVKNWIFLAVALPTMSTGAPPVPNAKWAYATSTAMIGLNPPFLERKLGPAKSKYDRSWTFEIGRCEVTYYIGRYGSPATRSASDQAAAPLSADIKTCAVSG